MGPADTRQVKEVINQHSHVLGFRANTVKVLAPLLIKTLAAIFQQCEAPSIDAAKGGTQIVRNGMGEGLQFMVGRFQFRRPRTHPLLQFSIEPVEFLFRLFALGDILNGTNQL